MKSKTSSQNTSRFCSARPQWSVQQFLNLESNSNLACFGTSTNHLAKIFQDEAKKHFTAPSDLPNSTKNIPMAGLFNELYTSSTPDSNSLETKLQRFFAEPPEVKSTDILLFWKSRGTIFPTLTQMASKYLSIPATSAPLEQIFSCGHKVLTYQQYSLSSMHVEQLASVKDWAHTSEPIYCQD
ncbi:hypothetical protein O181_061823 [Austropuccinia psidii MF-1]|uniref:HAT C-terminal dimerisation domain-containing protein n=1 Tax=Austropuccinia psidii MF-1 TaxID=1389203 RepID=A0A9Q3EIR4_9BASI|nr:hypothetical protein [Austropuccinia psidii MF-1]